MKRKIIVYTENYLPSIGGLENNTLLLCESLISLGFFVTLVTPQQRALKNSKFDVIESKSFKSFFLLLKKHDLLIVNGGVSFKIIIPALLARKPYIIIYQMATLFNDLRNNSIKTKILNKTRKLLAKFAVLNVGVSEYSFLELQQTFDANKVSLLINPANPKFSRANDEYSINVSPFNCLIAGRLIEGKGIHLLIEAIININKEGILVHLHVVGDGPEKNFVLKKTSNNFISYYPPVDKDGLKDILNSMNLTVIPSTHHIEGSPLIMAESLAMGVPVLVSSQPAMVQSIKYDDLIFESGDLENLINKLKYLTNATIYEKAKIHCKNISNQYSYDKYLNSLKQLIDV